MKRIIGIIILLGGIALILVGQHIKHRAEEGKGQVSSAQQRVDVGKDLFSVDPFTKEVGKGLTAPAQKKIDQGRHDIAYYESMAKWLQIGGIVLIVVGAGIIIIGKKKK